MVCQEQATCCCRLRYYWLCECVRHCPTCCSAVAAEGSALRHASASPVAERKRLQQHGVLARLRAAQRQRHSAGALAAPRAPGHLVHMLPLPNTRTCNRGGVRLPLCDHACSKRSSTRTIDIACVLLPHRLRLMHATSSSACCSASLPAWRSAMLMQSATSCRAQRPVLLACCCAPHATAQSTRAATTPPRNQSDLQQCSEGQLGWRPRSTGQQVHVLAAGECTGRWRLLQRARRLTWLQLLCVLLVLVDVMMTRLHAAPA